MNVGAIDWLVASCAVVICTFSGISVAKALVWEKAAETARIDIFYGAALGPFLFGLAGIIALASFPGAAALSHLVISLIFVAVVGLGAVPFWSAARRYQRMAWEFGTITMILLIALWLIALLINLMLPLIANDALEYVTVAKGIFESRSLSAYPALDPSATSSGFYGPWTHPPLYATLLYLHAAMQGTADYIGLMRFVSVWFAFGAISSVYVIGRLHSISAGLLSSILLVSTPLLFNSVSTSLIDSLPVAGLAIIIASVVAGGGSLINRTIVIGTALGLALWTHSQAVLFVPLCIVAIAISIGLRDWTTLLRLVAGVLVTASLIAIFPYLRNLHLFGAFISDNPVVFALPSLEWPQYFSIARGIDTMPALIQYGVLKGWFSLPSFGVTFWIMSIGLVIWGWSSLRSIPAILLQGTNHLPFRERWLTISVAIFGTYFFGLVASVAIGTDLMVKNERYLLVVLPLASLIGGYALAKMFSAAKGIIVSNRRWLLARELSAFGVGAFLFFALLQLLIVGLYYPARYSLQAKEATVSDGPIPSMHWLSNHAPENAIVFSLRPADMYYGRRKMVSYLDPKLLPVYAAHGAVDAEEALKETGAAYIHVPSYYLPPVYNSSIQDVLAEPSATTLVYDHEGDQVFSLNPSDQTIVSTTDISPNAVEWTVAWRQLLIPSRLLARSLTQASPYHGEMSIGSAPLGLFHRDFSNVLTAPELPVEPGREYLLTLRMSGKAFVRIWLGFKDDEEVHQISTFRFGELVAGGEKETVFARRFKVPVGAHEVRLQVEHIGNSNLAINAASLEELQ